MLYVFALFFGLSDAFFFPAQSSITPQLVERKQLQAANLLVQGAAQLSQVAGPVVAGFIIALLGGASAADVAGGRPDLYGIGVAFAIDALTFLASVMTLSMIRPPRTQDAGQATDVIGQGSPAAGLLSSIAGGITHVWHSTTLRWVFIIIAAVDFLVLGPLLVGVPVLADVRLPEGAIAFGIVMSAFGGGSFLGVILAGILPRPPPQHLGPLLMALTGMFGVGLVVFGLTWSTSLIAVTSFGVGAANGYVNILFVTWLQQRIPPSLLGRVMSLLMFASVGVVPVSQALCGALVKASLTGVFVGAGVLLLLVTLRVMLVPAVRAMGLEEARFRQD
jgi:MFS family permease